jgi:CRISPR/Cas system-associated exonuclease Cas4 (RecB family)
MSNFTNVSKEVTSLMGLIDTYKRWKNYQTKGDRSYKHYHPSEWGKCLRKQQYKHYTELGLIEVEHATFDSKILRLFDKGHNMHDRWTTYFDDIGGVLRGRWRCSNLICYLYDDKGFLKKDVKDEDISKVMSEGKTRIYGRDVQAGSFRPEKCVCGNTNFTYLEAFVEDKSLNLKGRSDMILDCTNLDKDRFKEVRSTFDMRYLPTKGKFIVGDFKTINQSSWTYQLEKRGPHKEYIIQIMIYSYILGAEYGVIMYENKNNSEMKWYKIEKNDDWWETIKWQAKTMIEMTNDRKLPPPRPTSKTTYDCKQCEFKQLCHKSKIWKDKDLDSKRKNFYKILL